MSRSYLCAAALFAVLSLPASAQGVASLSVNGQAVSPQVVIGSTGNDTAVLVTPLLQASGAKVQSSGGYLEALWPDNASLRLQVGSNQCTYG